MAGRAAAAVVLALQTGAFALFGSHPQIASQVRLVGRNEIEIVQRAPGSHTAITHYRDTEGEPVHVVLVRDDFRSFSHVHPTMLPGGEFRTKVALDAGHRFYAYVASEPAGMPAQVFRFILQAGAPPHHLDTTLATPSRNSLAGPYAVSLDRDVLPANDPALTIRVRPRVNAPLHAILVNTATLAYAHADAERSGRRCCSYRMPLPRLQPGLYRMWVQFGEGPKFLTAPFTIDVR